MAKTRIVALNKPYGVLTQFTDKDGRPTLSKFSLPAGVYPAGRLDFDSKGLLMLTDDGGLLHRLTDPRHAHPRVYWAQVERVPTEETLKSLRKGVVLSDGKQKIALVSIDVVGFFITNVERVRKVGRRLLCDS